MRWILIALAVLALAGGTWWWVAGGGAHETPHGAASPAAPARTVRTLAVVERQVPEALELSGTVAPVRRAVLSTRLSGRITHLQIEEGDAVHAGEVLARVDAEDVEAQVAQAQAGTQAAAAGERQAQAAVGTAGAAVAEAEAQIRALEAQRAEARSRMALAETEAARQSFLYREGAVPKQRAEQAQTELEVSRARVQGLDAGLRQARATVQRARASLGETWAAVDSSRAAAGQAHAGVAVARSNLSYAEIRSPFDGVVVRKMAWEGEMASPGLPVLEVQDIRQVRLEVSVPEEQLRLLHLNQSMQVHLDALDRDVRGQVKQIVPSGDAGSRTFTVKVALENPGGRIVPGMYGRLRLPQGERRVLAVPADTLVRRGQLEGVYVVDEEGVARLRLVKTGSAGEAGTEILSGLQPGERVVREPGSLSDGARVTPEGAR